MVVCGIYRIYNVLNGKSYVGQSVRVKYRINCHFKKLEAGTHCCKHLQSAFDLYGRDAFDSQLLEECSREDLTELEQVWMDNARWMRGLYNTAPAAGSTAGLKASDEARKRLSKSLKGNPKVIEAAARSMIGNKRGSGNKGNKLTEEHRAKIGAATRGRVLSEETKEKLRVAGRKRKGEKRKPFTEEHLRNLRESAKNRKPRGGKICQTSMV